MTEQNGYTIITVSKIRIRLKIHSRLYRGPWNPQTIKLKTHKKRNENALLIKTAGNKKRC